MSNELGATEPFYRFRHPCESGWVEDKLEGLCLAFELHATGKYSYRSSTRWSRRLTPAHRIVYLVRDDRIDFLQAR
jgi:hypothetical protein